MENKKILVFGSSGFLGRHLVESLVENNRVVQFDILPNPLIHSNSEFIQGSILDKDLILKAMKGIDIVYHFAAMTDLDIVNNNAAQAIEVNIAGTTNVLDACIQHKVDQFTFSSSVYVYSTFGGVYKSTKQACELLIQDYDKMHNLNYRILQLGSVYGPGSKKTNLINRMITEAMTKKQIKHYGTGQEERKYIFVEDVIKTIIALADKKFSKKKIILLGNKAIQISDLIDRIASHFKEDIQKIFKKEGYEIHYQSSPFQKETNDAIFFELKSPTSLQDGLKQTIQFIHEEISD
jgi:UDP-glucose 4-epimerase